MGTCGLWGYRYRGNKSIHRIRILLSIGRYMFVRNGMEGSPRGLGQYLVLQIPKEREAFQSIAPNTHFLHTTRMESQS